jgi:hypothetical protein
VIAIVMDVDGVAEYFQLLAQSFIGHGCDYTTGV